MTRMSMHALLWALGGCGHAPLPEEGPPPDLRVSYAPVAEAAEVPIATLPARVIPDPGGLHAVGPAVSGRLVRWLAAPGQAVAAGDPLAEIHSAELAELSARATELAANLAREDERLAERQTARTHGVASQAEVLEARARRDEVASALGALRQQLGALKDGATGSGAEWVWRAPVDGVLDRLTCSPGSVGPEDVCATLVRTGGVQLEVRVPERHLAALDGPVAATFFAADGTVWTGREIARAPMIDAGALTRTFLFEFPGSERPLAGASGRARLSVDASPGLHRVPAAALTRIEGATVVFVRAEDRGQPVSVRVLGKAGDELVVSGLEDEQEVAVRGVFRLASLALAEEP